jgi:hypothetical protein
MSDLVVVETAQISAVKTDQVKKEISVTLKMSLNGDNFEASNKAAFFAFGETPVRVTIEPFQQSFMTKLEKHTSAEA